MIINDSRIPSLWQTLFTDHKYDYNKRPQMVTISFRSCYRGKASIVADAIDICGRHHPTQKVDSSDLEVLIFKLSQPFFPSHVKLLLVENKAKNASAPIPCRLPNTQPLFSPFLSPPSRSFHFPLKCFSFVQTLPHISRSLVNRQLHF